MTAERRTLAALAAALFVTGGLVGAELGLGALSAGEYSQPNPCTQHSTIEGGGVSTELQRIALDGLARAACRLGTTRDGLALLLADPAKRKRLARGHDLEKLFRASMLQAVDEQRDAGRLGAIEAFVYRQAIEHTPLSLVERALGVRLG